MMNDPQPAIRFILTLVKRLFKKAVSSLRISVERITPPVFDARERNVANETSRRASIAPVWRTRERFRGVIARSKRDARGRVGDETRWRVES